MNEIKKALSQQISPGPWSSDWNGEHYYAMEDATGNVILAVVIPKHDVADDYTPPEFVDNNSLLLEATPALLNFAEACALNPRVSGALSSVGISVPRVAYPMSAVVATQCHPYAITKSSLSEGISPGPFSVCEEGKEDYAVADANGNVIVWVCKTSNWERSEETESDASVFSNPTLVAANLASVLAAPVLLAFAESCYLNPIVSAALADVGIEVPSVAQPEIDATLLPDESPKKACGLRA